VHQQREGRELDCTGTPTFFYIILPKVQVRVEADHDTGVAAVF
jgi:hypothetical protein